MANITVSVQSFLNSATILSIIIDNAQTVANLKTAINTAEGTPTDIMDLFFNDTKLADATTLSAAGLITGSYVKTSNNLTQSGLWSKQERQDYKLQLAQLRRQADGDTTQQYYRTRNVYDLTALPDTYNGNVPGADDNPNTGGLIEGRPWTGVAVAAAPTTIEESVPAATLLELESWYDASDGSSFTPNNPSDGTTFTQWADKSNFAHNANPHGGGTTRPTVQTNELNAYPVVRFDGVNDGLTINPYTGLVNAAAITVFAVAKLTATAGYPKLFGQAQSFDMFYSTDTNSWRFNIFGQSATSTGANDNAWHVHTVAFDGSQATNATKFRYRRDKTANTLSFSGAVPAQIGPTSQLDIGFYDLGTTQFMQGDLAEFLIFTKVLTDNEIDNVENYLNNKWGL